MPTSAFGSGAACAQIRPDFTQGGTVTLEPETAKQFSVGGVLQPTKDISLSVDWWSISVENTIFLPSLRQIIDNASLFSTRFIRDGANNITMINANYANGGSRRTQGVEFSALGAIDGLGGRFAAGVDGTLLLKKREKLTPAAPYGPSLIGVFTFAGDLGIRWKHNAFLSYSNDDVSFSLSQIFRKGYKNFALPGIAAGTVTRPDYNQFVEDYIIYNMSISYLGLGPAYKLTLGVRTCSTPIRRSRSPMTAAPAPAARGSRAWPIRAGARSPSRRK